MDVVFFSPAYPPEMVQFTRGLAEVGARVWGIGDSHPDALPDVVKKSLAGYLQVPAILQEDDVLRRAVTWLQGRQIDRIESNWEVTTVLAARLREALGVPGMSVDTVIGFRDKPVMRERVERARLRVPRSARIRTRAEAWEAADWIGFPLILKPVAGAGSADTWKVESRAQLDPALDRMGHVDEASIEEFVEGQEFTYETICVDGEPVYESVATYFPNALVARQNEWISPIIATVRDLSHPHVVPGVQLGRKVLRALGMGTGFTHMEWFRKPDGEAVFGEIACRPPGANMVDLMNYTEDVDLYREWARVVCWGTFDSPLRRPWNAAIVFKRAIGQGRIRQIEGLEEFVARYRPYVARVDLLPVGAQRRDWKQTFLSDGNVVVRHPDWDAALSMAREAAHKIRVYAG